MCERSAGFCRYGCSQKRIGNRGVINVFAVKALIFDKQGLVSKILCEKPMS